MSLNSPHKTTQTSDSTAVDADIVIYGATSAGVMTAVQAKRLGKSVALIEPGQRIGGMAASGLGATDIGNPEVIGGLAKEFYRQAYDHYLSSEAWKCESREEYAPKHRDSIYEAGKLQFFIEPQVAEQIFKTFLEENSVPVYLGERLDRTPATGSSTLPSVSKADGKITSIRMESGTTFNGKVFIDTSYEGDLMAAAGVSYMLGRESNQEFGETLNGVAPPVVTELDPYVYPGNPESGLLPGVEQKAPGKEGHADKRIQAYTFRFTLTDCPTNRLPLEKPENYDSAWYELLAREFVINPDLFPGPKLFKLTPMPNRKTDSNNQGLLSTDFVGQNYDWAEASYQEREQIWQKHCDYVQGLLWFLGNDEKVPENVREEVQRWGLPKDEFLESGHWPWQLYVREARRLSGRTIITEQVSSGKADVNDPVGMGSYQMDSHSVTRYVDEQGRLCDEGFFFSPADPYGISYQALTPKEDECTNLIVPVCLSATHVAYGSARMEPVFMILGQSAATAASLAIDSNQTVQAVDYPSLRQQLLEDGQVLELSTPIQAY